MKKYITNGGEMLDEICFAHYGNDNQSDSVLRANPGLEKQPFILLAGVEINLPGEVAKKKVAVTLW